MNKKKIQAHFVGNNVSSNDSLAHSLFAKSRFGEKVSNKIQYSLPEALFLFEKQKLDILDERASKKLTSNEILKKMKRIDKKIQIKYPVFKDLRQKGYILKTALKFGAEFRVYEKGAKIGVQHAKWILFTAHESEKLKWHDFTAKNRIAHSTKKHLLLAIVDDEESITYYEVAWKKP
jgi:tRNA-intron endonuclease, archaea type